MPTNSNGHDPFDPNQPVSAFSRGPERGNDICETRGRRANRDRMYTFEMCGESVHDLLDLLMKVAVESTAYQTVARAVLAERAIYDQARGQGF
jgi:hypothetical protein